MDRTKKILTPTQVSEQLLAIRKTVESTGAVTSVLAILQIIQIGVVVWLIMTR